jgi:hypothetical protein
MAAHKLVTCPETGHLEEIEYYVHPFARLIVRCSRYPGCRLDCPRTCTARLDRRDRQERREDRPNNDDNE